MQTNKAINLGVVAINLANQSQVEAKAIVLIKHIMSLQTAVVSAMTDIEEYQEQLNALQLPLVTDATILGSALPTEDRSNLNQKTIAKAINAIIEANQGSVATQSTRLAEAIIASKSKIESLENEIAKKREDLAKLTIDEVTTETILG